MGATARKTTTVASRTSVVPFARFLGQVDPGTAERIKNDDPIRKPETDAVARAIRKLGGIQKAEDRSGISQPHLLEIIFGGIAADACDCVDIENACLHEVKCEEMRPDLLWFRDEGGEVVGCAERLNGRAEDLEAAIRSSIADDGNNAEYHQALGMLWDLDQATRDRLLKESGGRYNADGQLWKKAQAIRMDEPELSTIAGPVHALGMASVLDDGNGIRKIADFYGIRDGRPWTAERYDDLSAHVRRTVCQDALRGDAPTGTPSWDDVLIAQTYGSRAFQSIEAVERSAQACSNLIDTTLDGITAIHDVQWVALDSEKTIGQSLDNWSIRNLAVFLKSQSELLQLLTVMRDNMLFAKSRMLGEVE